MVMRTKVPVQISHLSLSLDDILQDYRVACLSRQVSVIGRREVLSGKAKFGIFGDGKELPQLAMARAARPGDFRSGYYRDQTFMFATAALTIQEFFAQLYAHTDVAADPASAGRAMNAHFATRSLDETGQWRNLLAQVNSSADVSPTGSQMPRLVGLAYASRLYRELEELHAMAQFSHHGDEVAFGTIGNASCAEGMVWEAINAIGVLKAPAVISIYDDGYGISVTNEHQIVKADVSVLLSGFQRELGGREGFDLYRVAGWDYPALVEIYTRAAEIARSEHVPTLIHVVELTQPQGHSTSGSHERYKTTERLQWEDEFDGLEKMRAWMLANELATDAELDRVQQDAHAEVEKCRKLAWEAYSNPILSDREQALQHIVELAQHSLHNSELDALQAKMLGLQSPYRRDILTAIRTALVITHDEHSPARESLLAFKRALDADGDERISSHLYSQSTAAVQHVPVIPPVYKPDAPMKLGFEILNACFDAALGRHPHVIAFGEDVGRLGDVNQGFKGLQEKYGELRVSDTGIREATILGQAIGMAMRGLRPIAEIQYLDYLLYALQIMSDDLATLQWRTKGGQKAPVIVRTRGHRLEGVWHSGSPMAAIIHLLRGMHVLVPRNMTQAAGFYNTLLAADEPAVVVEVLNGYRLKERLPDNIGEFTLPLGVPEILKKGEDLTVVTYGACCRIALQASEQLSQLGIDLEVIDVQTLLPFDWQGVILDSLRKTNRILFVDEDVPGGTTAYMLQEVLERQGGFEWLDAGPRTLPGKPHRPAYGSDGDYWSKPHAEQVIETVYAMMREVDPQKYPDIF